MNGSVVVGQDLIDSADQISYAPTQLEYPIFDRLRMVLDTTAQVSQPLVEVFRCAGQSARGETGVDRGVVHVVLLTFGPPG
jgi:hypothetical protein